MLVIGYFAYVLSLNNLQDNKQEKKIIDFSDDDSFCLKFIKILILLLYHKFCL